MKALVLLFSFLSCSLISPQSIHLSDTTNQYDYIIITVPELVNTCLQFKTHKEDVKNLNTLVVDTGAIYSEFNSFNEKQDNIRDFISYAGTYWTPPFPKFVLLAGNVDMIPNFNITIYTTSFYSDYYYSFNSNTNDSTIADFFVGRIPVKNEQELENYFSKVIEYESDINVYEWMNNALFVYDSRFMPEEEKSDGCPPDYMNNSVFYTSPDSAAYSNKDSLINLVNETGAALIDFYSHLSSDSFFVSWEYFNINHVAEFNNQGKYFITTFFQKQHAIFSDNSTLAREMVVLPSAGSIGALVFNGYSLWGITTYIICMWESRIFSIPEITIGEAMWIITGSYYYNSLKAMSLLGDPSIKLKYDTTTDIKLSGEPAELKYSISQNYPNPFNPVTTINYSLHSEANVTIKVYDMLGVEVQILIDEFKSAGKYQLQWDASNLPSGVYLYKMQAGAYSEIKKMMVLK
jgi:hypothetical protein